LWVIFSFILHPHEYHRQKYYARSLCKDSMQLMTLALTSKSVRNLNVSDAVPELDFNYCYNLVVSEAMLLKIPPRLQVKSLTITGSPHIDSLDLETIKLLVV
jgi:hypothetical protein